MGLTVAFPQGDQTWDPIDDTVRQDEIELVILIDQVPELHLGWLPGELHQGIICIE